MNLRRALVLGVVFAGLGWLAGCGDSTTDPVPPPPPPPPPPDPPRATTVTVSPATAELTALGATVQLAADIRDQNGQTMAGATVTWATGNPEVATVDASGTVTAAGNGTATITATAGSASGSATVTVAQAAGSVTVLPAEAEVALGDTLRLAAEALDANGHAVEEAEFSWASSDEAVATVDASGLATGVAAGEAAITATSDGATGSAALTVLAPVPAEIAVTPETVAFTALGETAQLAAEVLDQFGRPMEAATVSWTSADTAVATVDADGLVTAAGSGATVVTAMAGDVSDEAAVSVMQTVGSVAVSPPAAEIALGDTLRLAAEAMDANGHPVENAAFSWASSDETVATVDADGLVTGVAAGDAAITATSDGATGRAALTVLAPVPAEIAVTPETVAFMALGETAQLAAEVLDQFGRRMEAATVSWTSADTAVATVDADGLVTAAGSGATVVTAMAGDVSDDAAVSVMQTVGSVTVSPAEAEIALGDTLRLAAEALDANGHPVENAEFSWASSDETVATVDASGLVTAIAAGAATMTASSGTASGTAELTVIDADRGVLVALYEATNGPGWLENRGWLSDRPIGEWHGVTAGPEGRVTAVRLSASNLVGSIPPELGNLARLETLDFERNELAGAIPPELGRLASLKTLILGVNDLTGGIPSELGALGSLEDAFDRHRRAVHAGRGHVAVRTRSDVAEFVAVRVAEVARHVDAHRAADPDRVVRNRVHGHRRRVRAVAVADRQADGLRRARAVRVGCRYRDNGIITVTCWL
ncbi:MAG: Ig-like domain-containing protein [Gemmatimonadetes bacterium]|nr:Ig-like domain-containing protein [Gemmatimonadota bacterium]